ncbi:hypothetical protein H9Q74_006146 [Fusarium xylarioides]|nr:hypothetical protein H9Q71_003729 [Fusarium xylarioides]KAG5823734.1 hypothetical protein H9Q74_006146 [Fusarium xylarioides]
MWGICSGGANSRCPSQHRRLKLFFSSSSSFIITLPPTHCATTASIQTHCVIEDEGTRRSVYGLHGKFIGVRFQNFIGDDVDVMAQSETIPNARIFQGAKDGFRPAVDAFLSDGLHDDVCGVSVPVLTKEFMANLPVGYFKVGMQLRLVNKQEDTYEYTPVTLREATSERASILLPSNVKLFSKELDDKVCIILEEVPFRRSSAEPSRLVRMKLT